MLTGRQSGRSLEQIIEKLSLYLKGWRGYVGFCETPSVLRKLDEWIRRRLRAVVRTRWKRVPNRFDELRRRGVDRETALKTAGNPRGPWRPANSAALARALPKILLRLTRPALPRGPQNRLICRTAVYVIRTYDGVGGGSRETPYPDSAEARPSLHPPFRWRGRVPQHSDADAPRDGDAICEARTTYSAVDPANAGTHNHRTSNEARLPRHPRSPNAPVAMDPGSRFACPGRRGRV
ncbi:MULTISPECIES: group II intron maturase-specific domain-containing protein [unclassified Bradyrhizobium]|uniref:group II intron maturase-specific domain-containing protein n=1 Tax=unclassified Bradyrhizobium TaxID=2631580 RepID=UPI0028E8EF6B|nr:MULTISPECIES: group II intron maturase-specific domain-containing protein [unclassified Bradyrhizobium]